VTQLNANWKVVDDPLQWILQRKKGKPRKGNSGWYGRSFCTTREGLLRCIRDYCGEVEPHALAAVLALPDRHSDWDHKNLEQNLDGSGLSQMHASLDLKSLFAAGRGAAEGSDCSSCGSQPALT